MYCVFHFFRLKKTHILAPLELFRELEGFAFPRCPFSGEKAEGSKHNSLEIGFMWTLSSSLCKLGPNQCVPYRGKEYNQNCIIRLEITMNEVNRFLLSPFFLDISNFLVFPKSDKIPAAIRLLQSMSQVHQRCTLCVALGVDVPG